MGKGFNLVTPDDETFHRVVNGELQSSTIDLVFTNVPYIAEPSEAITSDHKIIWGTMEVEVPRV